MTPAIAALDSGFSALSAVHGEPLKYLSAAFVIERETGEAITDEGQNAFESVDEDSDEWQTVTGIFDEAYELFDGGYSTTRPVIILHQDQVSDPKFRDVFLRDGTRYYVKEVRENEPRENLFTLIVSRDAQ